MFAKETKRKKMQLVHPRPNVNYARAIDALAAGIRELNSANLANYEIGDNSRVAPAAPSVLAVPSDFDVEAFVDELLRTLDQRAASGTDSGTGSVGDAAADAAAEHSASSQEFIPLATFMGALSTALTVAGFVTSAYEVYKVFQRSQRRRRGK